MREAKAERAAMQQSLDEAQGKLNAAHSAAVRSDTDIRQAVTRLKDGIGDDLVDRRLVTQLIVTYVDQSLHGVRFGSETQTLEVMSRILSFSEDEKKRVGLIKPNTGLLGWLGGAPEVKLEDTEGKSFEDLLTDFVEASAAEEDAGQALA